MSLNEIYVNREILLTSKNCVQFENNDELFTLVVRKLFKVLFRFFNVGSAVRVLCHRVRLRIK